MGMNRRAIHDRLINEAKEGDLVLLVGDSDIHKKNGWLFFFGNITTEPSEKYSKSVDIGETKQKTEYYAGTEHLLLLCGTEPWARPGVRITKLIETPKDFNGFCNPTEVYIGTREIVAGLRSHRELAPYAGMFETT